MAGMSNVVYMSGSPAATNLVVLDENDHNRFPGLQGMADSWRKTQGGVWGNANPQQSLIMLNLGTYQTFLTQPDTLSQLIKKQPKLDVLYTVRTVLWEEWLKQAPSNQLRLVWKAEEGLPPPFLPQARQKWIESLGRDED